MQLIAIKLQLIAIVIRYNVLYMNFVFIVRSPISNLEARSEAMLFDWVLTLASSDTPLLPCRVPARGLESCLSPRSPERYLTIEGPKTMFLHIRRGHASVSSLP